MDVVRNPMPIGAMPVIPAVPLPVQLQDLPMLTMEPLDINSLPEMERFTVELTKDIYGLGITIAGYVCEKGNEKPFKRNGIGNYLRERDVSMPFSKKHVPASALVRILGLFVRGSRGVAIDRVARID